MFMSYTCGGSLSKQARFQQAYFLANDLLEFFPLLFKSTLLELRDHLDRIRMVFFVVEKLTQEKIGNVICCWFGCGELLLVN